MIENKKRLIPVIKIKNFPFHRNVVKDFKSFLSERNFKEDCKILDNNKSRNKIFLYVNNSNIAYKFTEKYNKKFLENPIYSNFECSLTFKNPKNFKLNNSTLKPSLYPRIKSRKSISSNHYLNKSNTVISEYERKHWKNIREKAGIITNDSPYRDSLSKEYNEKLKNQKMWIVKKNFNVFIGKASSIRNSRRNEIKNYVMRTPSLPPSLYNFREINKNKWIGKSNFVVY